MERLSFHDQRALGDYFRAHIRTPCMFPWLARVDRVPDDLPTSIYGVSVNIGAAKKAFRSLTLPSRIKYVAYHWLYPRDPKTIGTDWLSYLLRQAGLDHLPYTQAVTLIREECDNYLRFHPRIHPWLQARRALLEFALRAPQSADFARPLLFLRNQLLRVVNLLWQAPEDATREAARLIRSALEGAAQAVHAELGGASKGALNASLMVPTTHPDALCRVLTSMELAAQVGWERAQALWNELPFSSQHCLMIVAETVHDEHVGFWVPLIEGDGGKRLPGAPEAFANHIGSAVFRYDPPRLDGFGDDLDAKWRDHIRTKVRGRHFVSLPLVIERPEGLTSFVAAVLNVNADPDEGAEWYRALHSEWLNCARHAAAPFIEIALYGIQARLLLQVPAVSLLDTLPDDWALLPGAPVPAQAPHDFSGGINGYTTEAPADSA